ncbi:MAG: hypothetical protein CVV46_06135 [Spirochaetae bacterium HGW-Spirochaetae-2]|jgi:hypothetical protein|nr:MAG: hypothetical protein CVV46_06135 [Spirochaetae bacterium HGW-Spirochaetae-2]
MAPKKGFMKASMGGMETQAGTAVARTARLAMTDFGYLVEKPTKSSKDVITGRNSQAGYDLDAIDYSAEMPTNLTVCPALAMMLHSLMGSMSEPVAVGCGILITYTGGEDSCVVAADGDGKSLSARIGNRGEELPDPAFGAQGVLDLTALTLGNLIDTVNGFGGYTATLLYGDPAAASEVPVPVAYAQAKGRPVPLHFTSPASTVKLRIFKPNYTNTENATFSIQVDGDGDNRLGSGAVVDSATISADLKAKAKASWSLMLLKVIGSQEPISLGLSADDLDVMKFNEGETLIAGQKHCYVKDVSVTVANNHSDDEGYCQGSLMKATHVRGTFSVTGSMTLSVGEDGADPSSEKERKKNLSNDMTSVQLRFVGRRIADGIRSMMVLDMPYVQYTDDSKSAGDNSLEQSLSFEAVDPSGAEDHLQVHMVGGWA